MLDMAKNFKKDSFLLVHGTGDGKLNAMDGLGSMTNRVASWLY